MVAARLVAERIALRRTRAGIAKNRVERLGEDTLAQQADLVAAALHTAATAVEIVELQVDARVAALVGESEAAVATLLRATELTWTADLVATPAVNRVLAQIHAPPAAAFQPRTTHARSVDAPLAIRVASRGARANALPLEARGGVAAVDTATTAVRRIILGVDARAVTTLLAGGTPFDVRAICGVGFDSVEVDLAETPERRERPDAEHEYPAPRTGGGAARTRWKHRSSASDQSRAPASSLLESDRHHERSSRPP